MADGLHCLELIREEIIVEIQSMIISKDVEDVCVCVCEKGELVVIKVSYLSLCF